MSSHQRPPAPPQTHTLLTHHLTPTPALHTLLTQHFSQAQQCTYTHTAYTDTTYMDCVSELKAHREERDAELELVTEIIEKGYSRPYILTIKFEYFDETFMKEASALRYVHLIEIGTPHFENVSYPIQEIAPSSTSLNLSMTQVLRQLQSETPLRKVPHDATPFTKYVLDCYSQGEFHIDLPIPDTDVMTSSMAGLQSHLEKVKLPPRRYPSMYVEQTQLDLYRVQIEFESYQRMAKERLSDSELRLSSLDKELKELRLKSIKEAAAKDRAHQSAFNRLSDSLKALEFKSQQKEAQLEAELREIKELNLAMNLEVEAKRTEKAYSKALEQERDQYRDSVLAEYDVLMEASKSAEKAYMLQLQQSTSALQADHQKRFALAEASWREEVHACKAKIEALSVALEEKEEAVEREQKMSQMQSAQHNKRLEQLNSRHKAEIQRLVDENTSQTETLLSQSQENGSEALSSLHQQYLKIKADYDGAITAKTTMQYEIDDLKARISDLTDSNEREQRVKLKEKAKFESDIIKYKEELANNTEEINNMRKELNEASAQEIKLLRNEFSRKEQDIRKECGRSEQILNEEINALRSGHTAEDTKWLDQKKEMNQRIAELEGTINRNNEKFEAKLTKKKSEIDQHLKEIEKLNSKILELSATLKDMDTADPAEAALTSKPKKPSVKTSKKAVSPDEDLIEDFIATTAELDDQYKSTIQRKKQISRSKAAQPIGLEYANEISESTTAQIQPKAAKAPKSNKAPVSQPDSVSEAINHSHTKQNTTSKPEIRQLSSSEPPDPDEKLYVPSRTISKRPMEETESTNTKPQVKIAKAKITKPATARSRKLVPINSLSILEEQEETDTIATKIVASKAKPKVPLKETTSINVSAGAKKTIRLSNPIPKRRKFTNVFDNQNDDDVDEEDNPKSNLYSALSFGSLGSTSSFGTSFGSFGSKKEVDGATTKALMSTFSFGSKKAN